MSERHLPVPDVPPLHPLPAPTVSVVGAEVVVELDDAAGERLRLVFSPHQAVRLRTVDVFVRPADPDFQPRTVLEVADSRWLAELTADLARVDRHATFMDHARHFLLTAGDSVIEVVAWGVEWSTPAAAGRHPAEKVDPGWP